MQGYILITPARNEEAYIEKTIQAVVSQKILPKKWIIVSDGSTDETDNIVKRYMARYDFIELIHVRGKEKRDFSSKVYAFKAGYERIEDDEFAFIGNLDGDVSFGEDYYEKVLNQFSQSKKLGIGGGTRYDVYNGKCKEIKRSGNSVMGAVQLFRRECYAEIGGYIPLKTGGIDAVAEIMARMHGWEVKTFFEIKVYHYRRTGTGNGNVLRSWLRDGESDYLIGYHPLFEFLRCVQWMVREPLGLPKYLCLFASYCWAYVRGRKREVPDEVVKYIRREQMDRLLLLVLKSKKLELDSH
jgi:glycosyltransferase involved in cell wall biosynthesis